MSTLTQPQKLRNLSFADLCAMENRLEKYRAWFGWGPVNNTLQAEINSRLTDLFPELSEVLKMKE